MQLQARGLVRRIVRGAGSVRGAVFFLFGVLIFGFWLWSTTFAAQVDRPDPDSVRGVVPLILLGSA